ncbi:MULTISPECIES: PolC-type DNA polymerase III [Nocardiopsis]|uniref:3'-5' exonuclease n=1 Tax=Nocardiopsis changdeensis TaxID=2831969 RepID=A0ABX8BRN8_9ACTN|nr:MULTISPECIES: 3'-5' exonuclease [Nocardiopsis]QUX24900.1 3'-5' exonuclease [Nocardiopsis changdeensis]QYX35286.1 3'-5' exonuclease [Nocardiopsis sp. MT53]
MFTEGHLTRTPGHDPRWMLFAVLDVATTGYHPERDDRIYEVAVARMRGDGAVVGEYSTLVNPRRPVPYEEHAEITDAHVAKAPGFDRVAGDLLAHLADAVVVAHKLDHEDRFLDSELNRMGVRVSGVPGLCTLRLLRSQLDTWPYKQRHLYRLLIGGWPAWRSNALSSARQLAHVLRILIAEGPQPLHWNGPAPVALLAVPRTGVITPYIVDMNGVDKGWLSTLAAALPDMDPSPEPSPREATVYRATLDQALADGKVVAEEAERLAELATAAGFTQTTIRRVHEQVLLEARTRAEADGVVTSAELRELERAAAYLGTGHVIQDLLNLAAQERERRNGPLKGWRIVPVGTSEAIDEAVSYAGSQGAAIGVNVTKTVRLVIAEEGETDPKVRRAIEGGHRVATPEQAREVLREAVSQAESRLFGEREPVEDDDRGAGENDRSWRASWRPRELGPGDYHREFVAPYADRDRAERRPVAAALWPL